MDQNQEKKISLQKLIEILPKRETGVDCAGLSGADRAYLISRVSIESRNPVVVVVPSVKEGETLLDDLRFFLEGKDRQLIFFPPYNLLPFKMVSYHNETASKRIGALYQIINHDSPPVIIVPVAALMQKLIPKDELIRYSELILSGEALDRDALIHKLVSGGYTRVSIVEEPGDFSVRGGILDLFSPYYPDPIRIELLDDTVDSLRFFSAATQRTISRISEAVILPAKETILKLEKMEEFLGRIRERASLLDMPVTKVRGLVKRIKTEGLFQGIESLLPLFYQNLDTFFDFVPDRSLFCVVEPETIDRSAEEFKKQIDENHAASSREAMISLEPDAMYIGPGRTVEAITSRKPLRLRLLPLDSSYPLLIETNATLSQDLKNRLHRENLLLPLAEWISDKKSSGHLTLIICSTRSQADRTASLLLPYGIPISKVEGFPGGGGKGNVYISRGRLSSGFVWADDGIAIITEGEIFGPKRHRTRKTASRNRQEFLPFEELKTGDPIVHEDHGIGEYQGLVKLSVEGATNDFILVLYRDGDKLYLPVDRMNVVQKYIGIEGVTPVLDKMGGKSWENVKNRVKRSAEMIAGELLSLYAERKVKKGFEFKNIDSYFRDFEAGFQYEETPDQIKAIEDVLNDMQEPTPMDRLICGDVGYGKTEVALRAAFLAINEGKQVAVLVPTTVLAEQHFKTFSDRFERYPFKIARLSRFLAPKEQREVLHDLKNGKIDIVIGTHRLLQKDVDFKDLGLLILDEEQRFGVKHKERLKKVRSTVDVLALSATPIPRTLHLSLTGIRDMSVISTPPEQRHSIITYISEFSEAIISEAIRKELGRKGQIFFVHNNVHSIDEMAASLKKLVPEVRLSVAHGQMNEDDLERVMLEFMDKEIDMLVCTTIIESGLDISSANTILINRADKFGLAQIYQLRGRVGRAEEQAFAYLFIPQDSALGSDARKRLKVLMEHSDLGSGFQIAMNDLKIRGGGTLLGASQSGHIAAVGYEMFLQLMENAISELKGEPVHERLQPEINVPISAFIPESYVPDIDQRLSLYRRLSRVGNLQELTDFKRDLIDRFGALPEEGTHLLLKIMLKILAAEAGVKRLDLSGQRLSLAFSETHQHNPLGIIDFIATAGKNMEPGQNNLLKIKLTAKNVYGNFAEIKKILKGIAQHVNG